MCPQQSIFCIVNLLREFSHWFDNVGQSFLPCFLWSVCGGHHHHQHQTNVLPHVYLILRYVMSTDIEVCDEHQADYSSSSPKVGQIGVSKQGGSR